MTLLVILIVLGLIFALYAVITQYQQTNPAASVPKRVVAAIAAAVGVLVAAASQWLHSAGTPSP